MHPKPRVVHQIACGSSKVDHHYLEASVEVSHSIVLISRLAETTALHFENLTPAPKL